MGAAAWACRRLAAAVRANPNRTAFVALATVTFAMLVVVTIAINRTNDLARANRALARQGAEAHTALCVVKADYVHQIAEGNKFITHPPKTIFGFPVTAEMKALAQSQVDTAQGNLDSLSGLECGR